MTMIVFSCYTTEISTTKYRGLSYVMTQPFFILGEIIIIFLAYIYLNSLSSGNWRAILFWVSMIILINFFLSIILLKESPRFLLLKGKNNESFVVLDSMLTENSK